MLKAIKEHRKAVAARNIVLLTMRQEPENPTYRKQYLIRISPPVDYIPPRTELETVFRGWLSKSSRLSERETSSQKR